MYRNHLYSSYNDYTNDFEDQEYHEYTSDFTNDYLNNYYHSNATIYVPTRASNNNTSSGSPSPVTLISSASSGSSSSSSSSHHNRNTTPGRGHHGQQQLLPPPIQPQLQYHSSQQGSAAASSSFGHHGHGQLLVTPTRPAPTDTNNVIINRNSSSNLNGTPRMVQAVIPAAVVAVATTGSGLLANERSRRRESTNQSPHVKNHHQGHHGRHRHSSSERSSSRDDQLERTIRDEDQESRMMKKRKRRITFKEDETEISCVMKYFIFSSNSVIWIFGLILLMIGCWAMKQKDYFNNLNSMSNLTLDPAFGLIVTGSLAFVIAFMGSVGALRENTQLLAGYAICLTILLVSELMFGILAFILKDWIKAQATSGFQKFIIFYRDDPDRQNLIDWIQESWLECCGIDGPRDWDMNIYFNCSSESKGSREACGVPFSCCRNPDLDSIFRNNQCGYDVRKPDYMGDKSEIISEKGCLRAGEEWIESNLVSISIVTVILSIIQELSALIHRKGCLRAGEEWMQINLLKIVFILLSLTFFQILGICLAQNLRADIFTQRSKWR